jgi:hypothetical protein
MIAPGDGSSWTSEILGLHWYFPLDHVQILPTLSRYIYILLRRSAMFGVEKFCVIRELQMRSEGVGLNRTIVRFAE